MLFRPEDEGIEFEESVRFVNLHHLHVGPRDGLAPPQAGNPYLGAFQCPFQRLHFSDLAAEVPQFYAFIEQVDAVLRNHFLYLAVIRKEYLDGNAQGRLRAVQQVVEFRERRG